MRTSWLPACRVTRILEAAAFDRWHTPLLGLVLERLASKRRYDAVKGGGGT